MRSAHRQANLKPIHIASLLRHLVLMIGVSACVSDGDPAPHAGTGSFDSSVVEEEGGTDDDPADAGDQLGDAETDANPEEQAGDDAGPSCISDEDCDDGVICNGIERCLKGEDDVFTCKAGTAIACTLEHPCLEITQGCDCRKADFDGDNHAAEICHGDDCDDSRLDVHRGQPEHCDLNNVDEDCEPTTFSAPLQDGKLDGDKDHDGYVSATCMNFDRELAKKYQGDDCDDTRDDVHPRNSEVCNYIDDNCDGLVDEFKAPESSEPAVEFAMRPKFYPDFDQDHFADIDAEPKIECDFRIPAGYIFKTADDCDDRPQYGKATYPGAPEQCDKVDNDCDGTVDEAEGMKPPFTYQSTKYACADGRWTITSCPETKLWCDGDEIADGCQTDGTRLNNCGRCGNVCQFSCGGKACDEVVQIAAGGHYACVVTQQGHAACWGRGALGRLGNDSAVSSSVPVPVLALKTVQRVATGSDHSCAVLGERRALACWGSNASGKLGSDVDVAVDGSTSVPITVSGGLTWLETGNSELELTDVQSVSLGTEHSCAVLGSGHLACWGQQSSGRLANGEVAPGGIPEPVIGFNAQMQPVTNARAVALGQLHGCILTGASQVECWGDNSRGQLGRDPQTLSSSSVVLPVPNLQNVTAIAVGAFHTCALSDQRVYCWGGNARLQLGNRARGPNDPDYLPRPLSSLSRVVTLAAGPVHTCATTDTAIYCWGANHRGELGKADLVDTATPVQVSLNDPLSGQVLVAPGDEFTCALVGSSGTACWGSDAYGELGRARTDYDPQPIPALIQPLKI